ncbi:MAG: hypothetical protein WAV07_05620 [Candidatus Contendobacter sp.]
MSSPTLMIRLREATREIHTQLEALPYPQALERRELPLESYVGHLRAMAVVHGVLETSWEQNGIPAWAPSGWRTCADSRGFQNRFPPHWVAAVRDALREAQARVGI